MATLVLTTVGGAIGGPVGAMLGGMIGQSVDREILKPKGREGPRLTELKVQTSSYGTHIPKLFGTLRVAGSVIWATELAEHRHREGGKGRPTTTSYSYTASFAVALSARPIIGVGRIWADGKLLRGAAGDWKASTGFRLHLGSENQAVDPLIASAEGVGAPAHRGMAYAVFEDLELADFGNRIPSLTFEVQADAGPMTAGAIVETVSAGRIAAGEASQPIGGFSAYGGSQRAVIEPLVQAVGAWPVVDDVVTLSAGSGGAVRIDDAGMGVGAGGTTQRSIAAADRAPRRITLSHYDPARDYQAGLQQATRPGAGHRVDAVELPAALTAAEAKALAEAMVARGETERERRTIVTGWQALSLLPGDRVVIGSETGVWRVTDIAIEGMAVRLELVGIVPASLPSSAAPGRVLPAPDALAGDTILHAFELPHLGEGLLAAPRVTIAACGTGAGWRRAALAISVDGGIRWQAAGSTALPAVMGTVEVSAGPASAGIEDVRNILIVELAHDGMALNDANTAALDSGANLAWVGGELLQFGTADALGNNRWRLSRLWRGRRGTEAAIGSGVAGDAFVLIEAAALVQHDLPASGDELRVMAVAPGDEVDVAVTRTGISVVPPSPVGVRTTLLADGRARISWTRRSRLGWQWIDGADAPLGEAVGRYLLRVMPAVGEAVAFELADPLFMLTTELRHAGPVRIEIRQAGDHGLSPPAIITVPEIEGD